MKKRILVAIMFLFGTVSLPAQRPHYHDVYPGTQQLPDNPVAQPTNNCSPFSKPSGIEKSVDQINPNDVNYGGLLAQWRLKAVDDFLQSFYYWAIIGMGLTIAMMMLYIAYLEHEKKKRLRISAEIVCQLYNSWEYASGIARQTIAMHNAWIDRLNDEYEKQLRGPSDSGPAESFALAERYDPVSDNAPADLNRTGPNLEVPQRSNDGDDDVDRKPNSASIPTLDAFRFADSISSKQHLFGGQDTGSKRPQEGVRSTIDVASTLASANQAAQASAESDAAMIQRQQAQIKAQADKISALQKHINRDRERRALESGDPNSVTGGEK